ncbi:hypothetical protein PV370_04195 [Streptomyces sp. NE06-03C]|nr:MULTISPECIES: hypothetical protein [Streptomyces]MDX2917197.1 hypothetical protein [Streptomyces sp. NE06-03C]
MVDEPLRHDPPARPRTPDPDRPPKMIKGRHRAGEPVAGLLHGELSVHQPPVGVVHRVDQGQQVHGLVDAPVLGERSADTEFCNCFTTVTGGSSAQAMSASLDSGATEFGASSNAARTRCRRAPGTGNRS